MHDLLKKIREIRKAIDGLAEVDRCLAEAYEAETLMRAIFGPEPEKPRRRRTATAPATH